MKKRLFENLGLKLVALLAAIVIWIIVVSVNDPVADKVYREIPVRVLNENVVTSQGKTYQINDGINTVSVTVRAQRSVLSRLKADRIEVTADLNEMTVSNLIPINVTIRGYEGRYQKATPNPLNLQVSIEDAITNKFPIAVDPRGTLRDGFALAKTEAEPQTVTISGPKSVIESINTAVAPLVLTGLSDNQDIKSELVLYDAAGEEVDQSRLTDNIGNKGVIVHVEVFQTKEVPIKIQKDAIDTPKGTYLADISYEPKTVEVAAEAGRLKEIEEIVIPGSAFDLSDVSDSEEVTLDLADHLPEGVRQASDEEQKIVVTFQVARLGEKIIHVPTGAISVDHLDRTLQVDYLKNSDLAIKVRGPQKVLKDLDLSQAVSIDLQDHRKAGAFEVPVHVELPAQCTAAPVTVKIRLEKTGSEDKGD